MESYDYRHWKESRKAEAKARQWDAGHWDIPYQQQAEAVEQAFRLDELCQKSFRRAARQLANIFSRGFRRAGRLPTARREARL